MNRVLVFFIAFKLLLIVCAALIVAQMAPQYAHHLLLVIALLLALSGFGEMIVRQSRPPWLEYEGRLIRIAEMTAMSETDNGKAETCCYPVAEYEYSVNGRRHTGSIVAHSLETIRQPLSASPADSNTCRYWWRDKHAGDSVPVYVNPANAGDAVLVRPAAGLPRSHPVAWLTSGLLFALAWLHIHITN
jgi:hypothetical protein